MTYTVSPDVTRADRGHKAGYTDAGGYTIGP